MPTQDEINEVLNWADQQAEEGKSKYPGKSYEEGVADALRWIYEGSSRPDE